MRNAGFDSAFIGGGVALALLSGTAIVIEPSLFYPILLLDLWVLGYHYVVDALIWKTRGPAPMRVPAAVR